MDAITLLTADHRLVEKLFKRYEKLGPNAHKTKAELVDRIGLELAVHAGIEETVMYPLIREQVPAEEDEVLEALEEHHLVKQTLAELSRMTPHDERFDAKVRVLMENVRHHVREEESDLFPRVRRALSRDDLADAAGALEAARLVAPRMAHPHAPDVPPANLVATALTLPVDLAGRVVRGVVRTVMPR